MALHQSHRPSWCCHLAVLQQTSTCAAESPSSILILTLPFCICQSPLCFFFPSELSLYVLSVPVFLPITFSTMSRELFLPKLSSTTILSLPRNFLSQFLLPPQSILLFLSVEFIRLMDFVKNRLLPDSKQGSQMAPHAEKLKLQLPFQLNGESAAPHVRCNPED